MAHLSDIRSACCTGCTACSAVCQHNAISMVPDDRGFFIPCVDEASCVDCGRCVEVCQIYHEAPRGEARQHTAWAVRHKDDAIRYLSASGAFFQAAAEVILQAGGYVCGAVLDGMEVKHILSNEKSDVARMADSKYVQSDIGDCYPRIAALLQRGIPVLFSGCSCQVAGLQLYLSERGGRTW